MCFGDQFYTTSPALFSFPEIRREAGFFMGLCLAEDAPRFGVGRVKKKLPLPASPTLWRRRKEKNGCTTRRYRTHRISVQDFWTMMRDV